MTTPTPPYGDLFADLTYSTVLPTGYASGYLMSDVASAALYSGWAPLMSPMFSGSVTVDGYAVINQYLDVSGSINASGSLSVSGSIYTSGAITASGSVTASGATSSGQLATLAQVQAQSTNYAPDTGMVNALAVTLTPTPTLQAGLTIRVMPANTNTRRRNAQHKWRRVLRNHQSKWHDAGAWADLRKWTFIRSRLTALRGFCSRSAQRPACRWHIKPRRDVYRQSAHGHARPASTEVMVDAAAGGGGGGFGPPDYAGGGGGGGGRMRPWDARPGDSRAPRTPSRSGLAALEVQRLEMRALKAAFQPLRSLTFTGGYGGTLLEPPQHHRGSRWCCRGA